jgi:hypothetical protein
MSDPQPISWRALRYGTPVMSADDQRAGEVHEVLGSDAEDIFHGVRLALAGGHGDVLVSAGDIVGITAVAVRTDLDLVELKALRPYEEAATYHLASVGWLRKHAGWQQDSKSDEEPG